MTEYKKHLLELPKEEIIERYLQVCENIEILDSSNKRLRKQLSIYGVGCSFCGGKEVRTTKNYKPAKKCCKCSRVRIL